MECGVTVKRERDQTSQSLFRKTEFHLSVQVRRQRALQEQTAEPAVTRLTYARASGLNPLHANLVGGSVDLPLDCEHSVFCGKRAVLRRIRRKLVHCHAEGDCE